MSRSTVIAISMLAAASLCRGQEIPDLTSANVADKITIAETFGSVGAEGISIGVDSRGMAHVASDFGFFGNTLYISHRTGENQWTQAQMPEHSVANNAHRPQLVVDKQDRLWVISHYFTAGNLVVSGTGLWTIDNVLNSLTLRMLPEQHIGPQDGWINGSLDVDDTQDGRCYIYTGDGFGRAVGSNGQNLGELYLPIGRSGEQHDYDIAQRAGGGVVHGCQAGSPGNPASYNNSARGNSSPIVWASYPAYNLGPDEIHPGVVGDSENPEIGYMACGWSQGLAMNIWNPTAGGLQRPSNNLIMIDPEAFRLYRKVPRMAAAKGGGAWITWTRANRVKLMFITQRGAKGPEIDIGPGAWPDVFVDVDGNLHLAYTDEVRMFYRKITLYTGGEPVMEYPLFYSASQPAGAGQLTQSAGNFETNTVQDELAVWNPINGNWYIRDWRASTPDSNALINCEHHEGDSVVMNRTPVQFGWKAALPVPADYNNDARSDLAVWHPRSGRWYIRQWHTNQLMGGAFKFGGPAAMPAPGNYLLNGGDTRGRTEPAVFYPRSGNWYIYDWTTAVASSNSPIQFGGPGGVPVPGNYDTNTVQDEIALYYPRSGNWYIYDWNTGRKTPESPIQFGGRNAIPVPADYDNDGRTDIAVWWPDNGVWQIRRWSDGSLIGDGFSMGATNTVPVPGNYVTNTGGTPGRMEPTVYKPDGGEWTIYDWNAIGGPAPQSPIQFGGKNFRPPQLYSRALADHLNYPTLWNMWIADEYKLIKIVPAD